MTATTDVVISEKSKPEFRRSDFSGTAISLDGRVAESWANQALIYERKGEMAKAAKSYSHALQLDPKYQPAKDGVARTRGQPA